MMRAAVIYGKGEMPRYTDNYPEPTVQDSDQLLITVKAAAIKHLDASKASGKHYSSDPDKTKATLVGGDGVGVLEDGTRVFALGEGMIAEKAIIDKRRMVRIPDGLDSAVAAALPNAVAGSAMALRFRAAMQRGETVLINGATGFTGRVAVQVAKYYGAKRIIVTGRNEKLLKSLLELGADEIIPIRQSDEQFTSQLKRIHSNNPIDIIIDYLWGHTAELIMNCLSGNGSFTHKTRFVSIGSFTGDKIQLSAENLRSVDLQLTGSGLGSWTKLQMQTLFTEIIPEMFQLAVADKLKVETVNVHLKDIEKLWDMEAPDGKRLVVTM